LGRPSPESDSDGVRTARDFYRIQTPLIARNKEGLSRIRGTMVPRQELRRCPMAKKKKAAKKKKK